jgi:hypothetical protein
LASTVPPLDSLSQQAGNLTVAIRATNEMGIDTEAQIRFLSRMKPIGLFLGLIISTASTSATVFLFDPSPAKTQGTLSFNDTTAGGYSETVFAVNPLPNAGIWHTMNFPGYLNYASVGPHVDSANLTLDITQVAGVPWFAATAGLSQAANVSGDTATLSVQFASYFEGTMSGTSLLAAIPSMGYNVSGVVGGHLGSFVSFSAQTDFFDNANVLIATLGWTYSNTTPGPFAALVLPTFFVGGPVLTDNLITVQGFITLQADPSSISISPVPEPTSLALLVLGGAMWFVRGKK